MVNLSADEESESWGEALLEERRDLACAVELRAEGGQTEVVLGGDGRRCFAFLWHRVGCDGDLCSSLDLVAQSLPVRSLDDALSAQEGRGCDPVSLGATDVFGHVRHVGFLDLGVWLLPDHLSPHCEALAQRLEVRGHEDSGAVDDAWVVCLEVERVVAAYPVVLELDHARRGDRGLDLRDRPVSVLGLVGSRIAVDDANFILIAQTHAGLDLGGIARCPAIVETGVDSTFVVDLTLHENLVKAEGGGKGRIGRNGKKGNEGQRGEQRVSGRCCPHNSCL